MRAAKFGLAPAEALIDRCRWALVTERFSNESARQTSFTATQVPRVRICHRIHPWRAGCGRSASPVRWEGEAGRPLPTPNTRTWRRYAAHWSLDISVAKPRDSTPVGVPANSRWLSAKRDTTGKTTRPNAPRSGVLEPLRRMIPYADGHTVRDPAGVGHWVCA